MATWKLHFHYPVTVWNQEFQLLVMDPSEQVKGVWLLGSCM